MTYVHGQVVQSTIAFFPGFPLSIRAVAWAFGLTFFAAAVAVEVVFQLAFLVLVQVLAADLWGDRAGRRAVVLVAVFPGAFIFSLLYCEPLMLTAALACLIALRRRRWLAAGVAAGLATAVTPTAVALVAVCAVAALVAIARHREWRSLIAPVLAPAGIVAYMAYLWASTGVAHAWTLTESQGWGEHVKLNTFNQVIANLDRGGIHWDLVAVVIGTGVAVALLGLLLASRPRNREDRWGWWLQFGLYSIVVLAMAFFSNILSLRPRFVLTAFPLVMVLAWRLRGVLFWALGLVFLATELYLLGVYTTTVRLIP